MKKPIVLQLNDFTKIKFMTKFLDKNGNCIHSQHFNCKTLKTCIKNSIKLCKKDEIPNNLLTNACIVFFYETDFIVSINEYSVVKVHEIKIDELVKMFN